ncbi:MAG: exosortase/archaeosortase family protein [Candidatus Micrarchaeia archaeon]
MQEKVWRSLIFAVAVFLLTLSSYFITSLEIEDTNPATYVVVPVLMLPVFAFFFVKEDFRTDISKRDFLIGLSLFTAFIVAFLLLSFIFSYEFLSFRIDLLILPLALASFAALIFGYKNMAKFSLFFVYAAFSSPAVLWPVLMLDQAFAKANTLAIFLMLKSFVKGIIYIAPITISTQISSIEIGQTCVSLGVFVALVFFLVPVAYFYEGKKFNKLVWVVSGFLLLVLLNILRMLSITYYWLVYGPSKVVAFIHEFIGSVLFYLVILIMILLAGKFGLSISKKRKRAVRRRSRGSNRLPLLLVLLLGMFYFLFTSDFEVAITYSPLAIASQIPFNASNSYVTRGISSKLTDLGFKSFFVGMRYGSSFLAWNSTINSTNPILIYLTAPNTNTTKGLLHNNLLKGRYWFYANSTISEIFDIISNNSEFFVYYSRLPFLLSNGSSYVADAYIVLPAQLVTNQTCSSYNAAYSYVYNLFNAYQYNNSEMRKLTSAFCVAHKVSTVLT